MEPARNQTAPPVATAVSFAVAATGVVRAGVEQLRGLRTNPGPVAGQPLPANFLKHADDQTVAGLAAVLQAAQADTLAGEDFSAWGVVAAPRFLARAAVARALERFATEGAWGVSPHLIPHLSLHSVSGTVSQALRIHGPNFGAGGGPHGAAKAMLAAAAMLADPQLPGLWLVLTGWNREPLDDPRQPGTNGHACSLPMCSAVALALKPEPPGWDRACLSVEPGAVLTNGRAKAVAVASFSLESLIDALTGATRTPAWRLDCGGFVHLETHATPGAGRL